MILDEIRRRWAELPSVMLDNTLQEHWEGQPDSCVQWSHCPFPPLVALYTAVAGIMPSAAGFRRYRIRPQPADLERLAVTSHTVRGPVALEITGARGRRVLLLRTPPGTEGELVVDAREALNLHVIRTDAFGRVHPLPGGSELRLTRRYTERSLHSVVHVESDCGRGAVALTWRRKTRGVPLAR